MVKVVWITLLQRLPKPSSFTHDAQGYSPLAADAQVTTASCHFSCPSFPCPSPERILGILGGSGGARVHGAGLRWVSIRAAPGRPQPPEESLSPHSTFSHHTPHSNPSAQLVTLMSPEQTHAPWPPSPPLRASDQWTQKLLEEGQPAGPCWTQPDPTPKPDSTGWNGGGGRWT